MKNIFTLLLVTASASAFGYDGGKLTISVPSSKNIQVYVDGRAYQDNENTIVLNNIQAGNHSITVYKTIVTQMQTMETTGETIKETKKTTGEM